MISPETSLGIRPKSSPLASIGLEGTTTCNPGKEANIPSIDSE
ncbi:MAG: hypothetical protein Q8755_02620 [Candidatus Phytoplasma australasiaticum]|nr:hypothetical protein [Candidatus Phytoplasma australasiaticum]